MQENWDRFLPQFKKKNVQRRKPHVVKDKRVYTPFPPAQQPSKVHFWGWLVGVLATDVND